MISLETVAACAAQDMQSCECVCVCVCVRVCVCEGVVCACDACRLEQSSALSRCILRNGYSERHLTKMGFSNCCFRSTAVPNHML